MNQVTRVATAVALAVFATMASSQPTQQPTERKPGPGDQSAPSQQRLKQCTAQAAAKRDAQMRDSFVKFCMAYDGSPASAVFAWNEANLKP